MSQGRNVVQFVKFTSFRMDEIALVVVLLLEQNHEMLRLEVEGVKRVMKKTLDRNLNYNKN